MYEICPELNGNPLEWLGNGLVQAQVDGEDATAYLDDSYITVENPLDIKKKRQQDIEQKQEEELEQLKGSIRTDQSTTGGVNGFEKAGVNVTGIQLL
jgi:hypothetical protein